MANLFPVGAGLLLAASTVSAQELRGGYSDLRRGTGQMQASFYRFRDGQFLYYSEGCGWNYGRGTYTVTADSLLLNYEQWATPAPVPPAAPDYMPSRWIWVWDGERQQPLAGAIAHKPGTTLGGQSNEQGWIQLPAGIHATDTVVVGYIGYTKQRLILTPEISQPYQMVLSNESRTRSGAREAYALTDWRHRFHSIGLLRTQRWLAAYHKLVNHSL